MEYLECNLNIRYDYPKNVWDKVLLIYKEMEGWLGFSEGGFPYWFSYNENEKSIFASIEPSGLHFSVNMKSNEWDKWIYEFKCIATKTLGFKVGEIEIGEVEKNDIEYIN